MSAAFFQSFFLFSGHLPVPGGLDILTGTFFSVLYMSESCTGLGLIYRYLVFIRISAALRQPKREEPYGSPLPEKIKVIGYRPAKGGTVCSIPFARAYAESGITCLRFSYVF